MKKYYSFYILNLIIWAHLVYFSNVFMLYYTTTLKNNSTPKSLSPVQFNDRPKLETTTLIKTSIPKTYILDYNEFIIKQYQVSNHVQERLRWECNEKCDESCVPEYKTMYERPWKNKTNSQLCPIETDLSGLTIELTMENTGCFKGDVTKICGNTMRESDVHMQYYSWEETNFMRTNNENPMNFLSSFISNCRGGDRLEFMTTLKNELTLKNETRVFNYGSCNRDTEEPMVQVRGRGKSKDMIAQNNKFIFSFENSQTKDYVTEKLFDMLSSGTVPVYRGATNARLYAPSKKSILFANEYTNAQDLAHELLTISKNNYKDYLSWKTEGPDLKWITLIDESIVHSQCRVHILAAEHTLKSEARWWIRERGTFHYTAVHDLFNTIEEMQYWISNQFVDDSKPYGSGAVVEMYRSLDRRKCPLYSLNDMRKLKQGEKIEVVMENPGWTKRKHFVDWWQKRGRPSGYTTNFQAPKIIFDFNNSKNKPDKDIPDFHACVMFRIFSGDEFHMSSEDLKDWIQYIRWSGVNHVHLYDNCQETTECQKNVSYDTYTRWPQENYVAAQISAIKHCTNRVNQISNKAWVLICDLDEYPFSPIDINKGFLKRIILSLPNSTSQILLRTLFFGGQNTHRPTNYHEPIIAYYKYHNESPEGEHHRTKSIFKASFTSTEQYNIVHELSMKTGSTIVHNPNTLRLNHYWGNRLDIPLKNLVYDDSIQKYLNMNRSRK